MTVFLQFPPVDHVIVAANDGQGNPALERHRMGALAAGLTVSEPAEHPGLRTRNAICNFAQSYLEWLEYCGEAPPPADDYRALLVERTGVVGLALTWASGELKDLPPAWRKLPVLEVTRRGMEVEEAEDHRFRLVFWDVIPVAGLFLFFCHHCDSDRSFNRGRLPSLTGLAGRFRDPERVGKDLLAALPVNGVESDRLSGFRLSLGSGEREGWYQIHLENPDRSAAVGAPLSISLENDLTLKTAPR